MSKVYATQTDLSISLNTYKDITGATSVKIAYRKPNNVLGEFDAVIENATEGIIKYDITAPLSDEGIWFFWAKIINSNGKLMIGEPTQLLIYKEGN